MGKASLSMSAPPPSYVPGDDELVPLESASPALLGSPPPYDGIRSPIPFHPTVHLQIQTTGKQWLSLPLSPRPESIPVYSLHPDEPSSSAAANAPTFTSVRPERFSGSCYLVASDATPSPSASTGTEPRVPVLSTTTYRFGLTRPTVVRLFSPHCAPLPESTLTSLLHSTEQTDNTHYNSVLDEPCWDAFTVSRSLSLLNRSVTFSTRLGTFQWRYASRRERRRQRRCRRRHHRHCHHQEGGQQDGDNVEEEEQEEEEEEINSLLLLERIVARGDSDELRTTVARFTRGPASRTPGSRASSAGNGGRLVVDLTWLDEGVEGGDVGGRREQVGGEKGVEREMAVAMVVTTCLVMLKREVDRRRAQQFAIMASVVGAL